MDTVLTSMIAASAVVSILLEFLIAASPGPCVTKPLGHACNASGVPLFQLEPVAWGKAEQAKLSESLGIGWPLLVGLQDSHALKSQHEL
ncbi:MAG: hypothetical protein ACR652_09295 [Methylocystis sp.]|uniref:hypothetical protein n=1 Tax=Methylocystis sp. TaxID=1911079 RepID=UPI003DA642AB